MSICDHSIQNQTIGLLSCCYARGYSYAHQTKSSRVAEPTETRLVKEHHPCSSITVSGKTVHHKYCYDPKQISSMQHSFAKAAMPWHARVNHRRIDCTYPMRNDDRVVICMHQSKKMTHAGTSSCQKHAACPLRFTLHKRCTQKSSRDQLCDNTHTDRRVVAIKIIAYIYIKNHVLNNLCPVMDSTEDETSQSHSLEHPTA